MESFKSPSPTKRKWKWIRWALLIVLPVVLLALAALTFNLGVRAYGFWPYYTPSKAMAPTLQQGDRFFMDARAYLKAAPQRGDVVVFVREETGKTLWVKRVMAIGGDVIEGANDTVTLNGKILSEPYVVPVDASEPVPDPFGPVTVPAGKLFVMGDNRHNSNDSRYFGFVDVKNVRGKVTLIFFSKDASRNWTRVH